MSKTAAELVSDAKGRVENLSVEEVAAELASGDAVLIDVRESDELAASGKIPGSVHVPRGMLEFRADPTSAYHQAPLDPSQTRDPPLCERRSLRARSGNAAGHGVWLGGAPRRRNHRLEGSGQPTE